MEPAIRIERTTCGLRITPSPTSDNLTPQETANEDAPDVGADGAWFLLSWEQRGSRCR